MRALAMLLCSTVTAAALGIPEPGKSDEHMRAIPYDPMNRTVMVLTLGRVANIQFNAMERIKRVIFSTETGPVSSLKIKDCQPGEEECAKDDTVPLINNLPLFGKSVGKTDLIAITVSPDDRERVYQFFIEVRPAPRDGSDDPAATYGLRFTYAEQEKAARAIVANASWQERRDAKQKEVAESRLNTDVFYGPQNWKYMAQGRSPDLAPTEAHDNGRIAALRYPGNSQIPTVLIVTNGPRRIADACTTGKPSKDDSLGDEQIVQTTHIDDMLIVQQIAPHMRLRLGNEVAELYNCGWDPAGINPGTGTTSPDVVRRLVVTK